MKTLATSYKLSSKGETTSENTDIMAIFVAD